MLKKLIIQNVALINSAEISFTNGLNVLSGETGSGKSVIIESLNFVLGAKADKSLIRSGENECCVKAEFDVSNNKPVQDVLTDLDIDNDALMIISRKFSIDGKSSIKINGNSVTAGMLKRITVLLVDVHGQSEHFYLMSGHNQLNLLDKFGGDKVSELKIKLNEEFNKYKSVCKELNELGGDESQRLTRLDILNYQINEIERADIKENEEDELNEIKNKLIHQEKISLALSSVKSAISDEGGVNDVISNVTRVLSSITELGQEYYDIYERLNSVFSELDDISDTADSVLENFDFFEYNADEVENRLELIKNIKKKYGGDFESVLLFLDNAKNEREKLENYNVTAENLIKAKNQLESIIYNDYVSLSNLRRSFAKIFADNVLKELQELGMSKANFEVKFNEIIDKESCRFESSNGFDVPEFMFSANLGEPLKTLSAVISGGEMSRFMLSIKAQTAKYNDISTFIFDEIDAGISGVVAKIVAEKFAKIAKDVQIIAITHLPQISAMADNNLLISKKELHDKTITEVNTLNPESKVEEIIRLTGGDVNSESAKKLSEELILLAKKYKESLV